MSAPRNVYDPKYWYDKVKDTDESVLVKNIIRSAIECEDTSKFDQAAQKLNELAAQSGKNHQPKTFVTFYLPDNIAFGASAIPYNHPYQDNLTAFMKMLQRLPQRDDIQVCPEWSELFGEEFSYNLSDISDGRHGLRRPPFSLPDFPEDHVAYPDRWRNFNSYGARLVRDGLFDCYYLFWYCVRDAFDRHMNNAGLTNIICDWLDIAGYQLFSENRDDEWDKWASDLANVSQSSKSHIFDDRVRSRAADAAARITSMIADVEDPSKAQ